MLRETIGGRGAPGREHVRRTFVSSDTKLRSWTTPNLRQSDLRLEELAQFHREEVRGRGNAGDHHSFHGVHVARLEHRGETDGTQRGHGRNLRRRIAFLRGRLKAGRERLRLTLLDHSL